MIIYQYAMSFITLFYYKTSFVSNYQAMHLMRLEEALFVLYLFKTGLVAEMTGKRRLALNKHFAILFL